MFPPLTMAWSVIGDFLNGVSYLFEYNFTSIGDFGKRFSTNKVQFRTIDDAIKIRSNRKILKQWPHLYMKYGRDQNKNMKRPDNEQPDEEVDELADLAGKIFICKFLHSFIHSRFFQTWPSSC